MAIWIVIILGLLQGLTEFLPLSSSGHLLLLENFLEVKNALFFNLVLHLGSLIAVVFVFWKEIVFVLKNPFSKLSRMLLLSTFCTVAIAFSITKIPGVLEGVALGPSFIVTGIVLVLSEIISKKTRKSELNATKSFFIGVVQGVAVLPGISRSGSTVSTARILGMDKEASTNFSFLLSIPVIVGGMIFEIFKTKNSPSDFVGFLPCIIGFCVAAVSGFFALIFIKKLLKNQKWWIFAPYLILLGVAVSIWQYA